MSSANRVFVEISLYSLQLVIVAGRRLVAKGDYPLDAKEALLAFFAAHQAAGPAVVLVSPKQSFARLAPAGTGGTRTETDLLAAVSTSPTGLTPPLSVVACDAVTGEPFDSSMEGAILLAGATTESLVAVRDQMGALGLPVPASTCLALPVQLGAVVAALQDMSESTRVAVLALGENDSVLALVSAGGVEAVQSVPVGYAQIFEAVKAELGLKFRAAATKLFFNSAYDFADASDKIAVRLAEPLQAALSGFPNRPTALQVVGLPGKQAWLGGCLAQALSLADWSPDMAKMCAQLELEVSPGSEPTANALSLVQLAATDEATPAMWQPGFLGERPKTVSAPVTSAPAVAVTAPVPVVLSAAVTPPAAVVTKSAVVGKAPAPVSRVAAPTSRPITPAPVPGKQLPPKPLKTVAAVPTSKPAMPAPAPRLAPVQAGAISQPAPKAVAPLVAPARSKPPVALYAVILAVVLVAIGVGIKIYLDESKQAKAQQVADESARLADEQARKLAVERAEAALRLNPATGLPGSWQHADIGLTSSPGAATFAGGIFNLTGVGRDIGWFKDGFNFIYVPLSGDGSITARVAAMEGSNRVAKAGLMIRSTLEDGSAHVSLLLENKNTNYKLVSRAKRGGRTVVVDSSGNTVFATPIWFRLVRAGDVITAYQSSDGKQWNLVAGTPVTVPMSPVAYIGMAACSRELTPVMLPVDHVSVPGWSSAPSGMNSGK